MELPNIKTDSWELRSAEESHAAHPDTFDLPDIEARRSLERGDAAKLIFDIESQDDQGVLHLQGERMFVIVSEVIGDHYIGILDSQPISLEPADEQYLCFGAEIPFTAEHVIVIGRPPEKYIEWQLAQPPERRWRQR